MAYLPNKKILALIIFILLGFAGWFYFSRQKDRQLAYEAKKPEPIVAAQVENTAFELDSDSDGLKDWEETLWKTDPKNPDTDGDGATDNEEISQNRNPLKPGPDDKISKVEDLVAANAKQAEQEQTVTTDYAKKFLAAYLTLKQEKGELFENDKQDLVEEFIKSLGPLNNKDRYSLSDLKVSSENSETVYEQYSEEIKSVFAVEMEIVVDNLAVFEDIIKDLNDKNFDKKYELKLRVLEYSANFYTELSNKLISFKNIPTVMAESHLKMANTIFNIKIALDYMKNAADDPVKAMMGQRLYQEQIKEIYQLMQTMQGIFNKYGIKVF